MRNSGKSHWSLAAVAGLATLLLPGLVSARSHGDGGEDRVAIFSTIDVEEDSPAADIACAFCTVRVNGDVHGDVAVIFSTVDVGEDRTISGDVATLFSTLRLGEGAKIGGDLATALGTTSVAPGATVQGDRAVWSSGLGVGLLLAPLLIVAGVIWLLVWVIRRVV